VVGDGLHADGGQVVGFMGGGLAAARATVAVAVALGSTYSGVVGCCLMPQLEISDLITAVDPDTGRRLPVRRSEVVEHLRANGNVRAARLVAELPADQDGVLDPGTVDRLLISVHTELQRLSEELRIGQRLVHLIGPLLTAIRAAGHTGPFRLVDIGCGLGLLVRWLAATSALGPDIELVGVDLNAALPCRAWPP
jgi:hypothetical protein